MTGVRRRRLQRERAKLMRKCLPVFVLKEVWAEHVKTLPLNALYPSVGEVFRYPTVQAIIDEIGTRYNEEMTIKPEQFNHMRHAFPRITARWHERVRSRIDQSYHCRSGIRLSISSEHYLRPGDNIVDLWQHAMKE